jgi:clan AA aspartic protease (TIGR02281 family)
MMERQSRWVKSYTAQCGVSVDGPVPSLPIPQSVIECYRRESRIQTAALMALFSVPTSQASSPPAAAAPQPASRSAAESIQLEPRHGTYTVSARINDQLTLPFIIDTGASNVVIPSDVASTLIRTGTVTTSDFIGTGLSILADGSKLPSLRLRLRELKVGDHTVRNVTASVVPAKGELLLGQSFLSKLPKGWWIDYDQHGLVLPAGSDGPQHSSIAVAPVTRAPITPNPAIVSPPSASTLRVVRIRLGATSSAEAAREEWARLKREHPNLLGKLTAVTIPVDLGDKGLFYRIEAGPLTDAGAADRLCAELKQRMIGCAIAERGDRRPAEYRARVERCIDEEVSFDQAVLEDKRPAMPEPAMPACALLTPDERMDAALLRSEELDRMIGLQNVGIPITHRIAR